MDVIQNFMHMPTFQFFVLGIIGLIVGRYMNIIVTCLPRSLYSDMRNECLAFLEINPNAPSLSTNQIFPMKTHSCCSQCLYHFRWIEKIPIISYLFLKGQCPKCFAKLDKRIPITELISLILVIALVTRYGLNWQICWTLLFLLSFTTITAIDIEHHIIPDNIVLPILWVGLILSVFHVFISPKAAILGAAGGYLTFWLLSTGYKIVTKQEGLGLGDAKLLAMIGAWQGFQLVFLTAVLAFLLSGVISMTLLFFVRSSHKRTLIPFSPMLLVGGLLAFFWGEPLLKFLLNF